MPGGSDSRKQSVVMKQLFSVVIEGSNRVYGQSSLSACSAFAHLCEVKCNPFFCHSQPCATGKKFRDAYRAMSQMGSSKDRLLPCSRGSSFLLFLYLIMASKRSASASEKFPYSPFPHSRGFLRT